MFKKLVRVKLLFLLALAAACNGESQEQVAEEDSECPYKLPWSNTLPPVTVSQGANSPKNYSHRPDTQEQYAIDFSMSVGTPVLASRDGQISKVQSGSTEGGPDRKYVSKANYVILDHGDEATYYTHLDSTAFTENDIGTVVQRGQLIGFSGNTGWSTNPHLHFQVQEKATGFGQSIPFCFSDVPGGIPQAGKSYVSQNQPIMVQGIRVEGYTENIGNEPSGVELVGIWEGEVTLASINSDGSFSRWNSIERFEIKNSCVRDTSFCLVWLASNGIPADEGCANPPCHLIPDEFVITNNSVWSELEGKLNFELDMDVDNPVCFIEEGLTNPSPFCFSPVNSRSLKFVMAAPLGFGMSGILYRIGAGESGLDLTDPASIAAYIEKMMKERNFGMVEQLVFDSGTALGPYFYELPMGEENYHQGPEFARLLGKAIDPSSRPTCVGWQINRQWNPPSLQILFDGVVFNENQYGYEINKDELLFFLWPDGNGSYNLWGVLHFVSGDTEFGVYDRSNLKPCN